MPGEPSTAAAAASLGGRRCTLRGDTTACRSGPCGRCPAAADRHITVPVPAIVDEALFASAAEQLEENRRRSRERLAGVRYLLRGLLVCRKCGYGFTGHHHRGRWRYYRCCGTDRSRFHGQFRCDARLVAVEPLDAAVWDEVCRLLKDPARVLEEYQQRLDAVQASPRRLELDVLERQVVKARRAIDRVIDGYAEGLIEKPEFEPRIAELRSRAARLEAEAEALRAAEEQAHSLQLVIGKLGLFATMVRDRLEAADWPTMRDIICTLVRRIEVADDAVRVVFRVDPGSSGPSQPLRHLPHCPTRRDPAPDVARRHGLPLVQHRKDSPHEIDTREIRLIWRYDVPCRDEAAAIARALLRRRFQTPRMRLTAYATWRG